MKSSENLRPRDRSGRGGRKFESCHSDQSFQWHGFFPKPHPDSYPDRNVQFLAVSGRPPREDDEGPEAADDAGAEDDEQDEEAFQKEARRLGLMDDPPANGEDDDPE